VATDATGTPTSLGIPKFDPTNDAPSGLGGNAQMDAIDALLTQTPRSGSIAGIAVGSVPVWNGTAWVKPSGTPDGTKFLRDDGSWQTVTLPTTVGYGTALPGSPADGDEYILVDSAAAPSYSWRFRYVSAKASNKWVFIGGPAMASPLGTLDPLPGGYSAGITNTGNVPVTGIYDVTVQGRVEASGAFPSDYAFISYSGPGLAVGDAHAATAYVGASAAEDNMTTERTMRHTLGSAAAVYVQARARSSLNIRVRDVSVHVLPVQVGG
jgi:hypothetical protein